MQHTSCSGWWEQDGYGRQPMEQLEIRFQDGRIQGTGTDIVGPFRLDGVIEQGRVSILKQYLGQHHVEYYGVSDGEGTLYGHWGWSGLVGGKWMIQLSRGRAAAESDIRDITDALVAPKHES